MGINDFTLNVTSICVLSLSHIGQKGFTDFDTAFAANDPNAIAINKSWGPVRNDLFREFKWPFANVIEPMQLVTTVDSDDYPEWSSFYTYTLNAATVWYVFNEADVKQKEENEFEVVYNPTLAVKIVCCNCDTLNTAYCEYTRNVTDTLMWDTKFVMAFSYRLAASIVVAITGDTDKALKLMEVSNAYISETKRVANYEKKKKPEQTNEIVNSRG